MTDAALMQHALTLARRNLGQAWPNPAVGAVIARDGVIVGRGWTARGGRPHAETQALAQAGEQARDATMYVTLEPCSNTGKTPPCTDAIIKAGIARVVIACRDANPLVDGVSALRSAGIEVKEGVCEVEAHALNEGFFSVMARGRPFVAMKAATSLDAGMVDPAERWITGEQARAYGHVLRSEYDAILTGIGTALTDDPLLTCRLPGLEDRSPVRVVLDRQQRLPATSKLKQTEANVPVWVEHECDDLAALLKSLAQRGITRVLVEAGPTLSNAFLAAELVDRLYWFRAPVALENKAAPQDRLEMDSAHFRRVDTLAFAQDSLEVYDACSPA